MKEKDTLLQYRFDEKVSEGFANYGFIPHQFFEQADFIPPKPPYTLRMTEIRKKHRLTHLINSALKEKMPARKTRRQINRKGEYEKTRGAY